MTRHDERTRSLVETGRFLRRLMSPDASPGVPEEIRRQARWLERHFPTLETLHLAHLKLPELFGPTLRFECRSCESVSGEAIAGGATENHDANASAKKRGDETTKGSCDHRNTRNT